MERIKENVLLSQYSTFRIGGPARYLVEASNSEELKAAIQESFKLNLPFLVIGSGSNILFPSKGYNGLIIVFNSTNDFLIKNDLIKASAALPLNYLISNLKNYTGLEWAAGIPGTLGGAINGNAGALKKEMAEIVKEVDCWEIKDKEIIEKKYPKEKCKFSYRSSVFKNNPNLIIVSATLQLQKGDEKQITERIKENISKRSKQPKGFSIGSIFKNGETFSAGELIEKAGLKGKQIGGVKISEEHANFIINLGNATSEDVLKLIEIAKEEVRKKFSVNLEEEIKTIDNSF